MNLALLEPTLTQLIELQPKTTGLSQVTQLYIKGLFVLTASLHKEATYDTYLHIWDKFTKPCNFNDVQHVFERTLGFSNIDADKLTVEDQTKLVTHALTQTSYWKWLGGAASRALEQYALQDLSPEERNGVITAQAWLKESTREICNLPLLRFTIIYQSSHFLENSPPLASLPVNTVPTPVTLTLPKGTKKRWYSFLFKKFIIRLE